MHVANNETADVTLASEYRSVYGSTGRGSFAVVDPEVAGSANGWTRNSAVFIDQDIIVAAPLWHDWAKTMVFQWNADGSEFAELNFGGNGTTDNYGQPGDSHGRTPHHRCRGSDEARS